MYASVQIKLKPKTLFVKEVARKQQTTNRTQQISAVLELSVRESIRAYGGCLGFKKAMKDAVWRRYASGRCQATFDPEMSEWGNPSERDFCHLAAMQGANRGK